MTFNQHFQVGEEADKAVQAAETTKQDVNFTSFKSGTTLKVKVAGTKDYFRFYSYGIYNLVDSFIAETPSKKTAKGFPVENLTPWDKAFKHHKDQSQEYNDAHGTEAYKYKPKERFAMAFIDLATGEPIAVDVSKNQHNAIKGVIEKYASRLGKLAFELSKSGSSTSTVVSLSPVIDMEEDLTDAERKHFAEAPESIDVTQFFGAFKVLNETDQVEELKRAGFDVTLIGYDANAAQDDEISAEEEEGLPF